MTSSISRDRATLKRVKNRQDVNGCTEIRGDEWCWMLKIKDAELTNATLIFTAKYSWDDSVPAITYTGDASILSSIISPGITVSPTSNAGQLDAYVVIAKDITRGIDVGDSGKVSLCFDVQINRTTHLNSPEVETYFRRENSQFNVIGDITQS